jgi:uncharacterized membrane protein
LGAVRLRQFADQILHRLSFIPMPIGIVLGTTVFCLLALRSTRDFGDDGTAIVPHVTVLVAVALGLISLVAVVRAVDHLTRSVRVGSVAQRIADETIEVVDRVGAIPTGQRPDVLPAASSADTTLQRGIPGDATAVEAPTAGWIQQIDEEALAVALPEESRAHVPVSVGGFVPVHAPLVWVSPAPDDESDIHERVLMRSRSVTNARCNKTSSSDWCSSPTSPSGHCHRG